MTPRFTTLDAWLDWQVGLHPKRMDLGLERVAQVWSRLGPAVLPFPVVTVGGTNGKGSCVAMIEAMALAAGYSCGCYTSPHLLRYNERVRLAGEPVADQALCDAFARVDAARGEVALTYFEFGTLAALDLLVRARPDLVVLEVGLGGRLDAVNLVDADVAVVTSIGLDHTAWLGDTLEQIAVEKAGIFRPGRPAVMGQRDAPVALRARAEQCGALPLQLGREFAHAGAESGWTWVGPGGERLALPVPAMRGGFQLDNAAAAITALTSLRERLPLPVNAIRGGLLRARLPGRFQVVPGTVSWILDVAHNGAAAAELAANLQSFGCQGQVHAVLAVLADKDPVAIATPLLPYVGRWYLAQSDDARALPVERLVAHLEGPLGSAPRDPFPAVDAALEAAVAAAAPGDCILVFGSFTTVSRALRRTLDT